MFDLYRKFVEDKTESPMIYHRWALMTGIGAFLGRKVGINMGHFTIYPNMYTLLVGPPGSRKSSAIKIIQQLLLSQGYNDFAPERTTKEAFVQDLFNRQLKDAEGGKEEGDAEEFFDQTFGNLFNLSVEAGKYAEINTLPPDYFIGVGIFADEVMDFFSNTPEEFLLTLTTLWDNKQEYHSSTKTSSHGSLVRPTVTLLGGTTESGFRKRFLGEGLGAGLLTRTIIIPADDTGKRIPFPEPPDPKIKDKLKEILNQMDQLPDMLEISPEAKKYISDVYLNWKQSSNANMTAFASRRQVHLLKLCIIISAINLSPVLKLEHAVEANTLLSVAESAMQNIMRDIFLGEQKADIMATILDHISLSEDNGGATIATLWQSTGSKFQRLAQLQEELQLLIGMGIIMETSAKRYIMLPQTFPEENKKYLDLSYLWPGEEI